MALFVVFLTPPNYFPPVKTINNKMHHTLVITEALTELGTGEARRAHAHATQITLSSPLVYKQINTELKCKKRTIFHKQTHFQNLFTYCY